MVFGRKSNCLSPFFPVSCAAHARTGLFLSRGSAFFPQLSRAVRSADRISIFPVNPLASFASKSLSKAAFVAH